jgi:predicted Rossmann fold nucleotide-binding protein DprA/Smf involved in DNA uptake
MNQQPPIAQNDPSQKDQLKALRKVRKQQIAIIAERVKDHNRIIEKIVAQIRPEGKTVTEIAQATGIPAQEVLWYLATLKRYGKVSETQKAGSYYRYQSTEGQPDARTS